MNENAIQLPKYTCHKEVHALKIKRSVDNPNGSVDLFFEREQYASINIEQPDAIRFQNKEDLGGYYVVYDDEYVSWSPANIFEAGYNEIV